MKKYKYKVVPSEYPNIRRRALSGESTQSIANTYGCTRENIRLILKHQYGISTRKLKHAKQKKDVEQYADEILYYAENWLPVHWENYPISLGQFERALSDKELPFLKRWSLAKNNPTSYRGQATRDGRVCTTCKVYMPWSEFYKTKGMLMGKSNRCKSCSRAIVDHYQGLRHVPTPTVTHKECPMCGVTKPASDYWRCTTNNSGLQTYCKRCHHKLQEGERVPKK